MFSINSYQNNFMFSARLGTKTVAELLNRKQDIWDGTVCQQQLLKPNM